MNWALCWPQSPPPDSEKGTASGVKKTPESSTPAPPLIWYLLLLVSDQRPSCAKGPSVAASQVGGAPPATLTTPPAKSTLVPLPTESPLGQSTHQLPVATIVPDGLQLCVVLHRW